MNALNRISDTPLNDNKHGQIGEWIGNLVAVADEASRLGSELESRLTPIARPEVDRVNNPEKEPPQPTLVQHADTLRNLTRIIEINNNRLRSLLGRIEL